MKILFCNRNGLRPYHMSGAEETMDEFLKILCKQGFEVLSVNCIEANLLYRRDYASIEEDKIIYALDIYQKVFFTCKDNYSINLTNIIKGYSPDLIFSQLNSLDDVYNISKYCSARIVYFFHSYFNNSSNISDNYSDKLYQNEVQKIICLSHFIQNSLPFKLRKKSSVIYPCINFDKYRCNALEKKYIIFFNPIKMKGIEIIIELAKVFTKECFKVYETWSKIPYKYHQKINKIPNISLQSNCIEPKEIYKDAKVFLMPSQCEEGFGRGIIEANLNGIPIIASDVGGIKEAAGERQLLIENYTCINEWIAALNKVLTDFKYYDYLQILAYKNAERYSDLMKNECNEHILSKQLVFNNEDLSSTPAVVL